MAAGPDWNGEIRPGPTDIGFDSADPIRMSYGQP